MSETSHQQTNHTLNEQIEQVIAARDFGTPSARKLGRNTRFPFVPIIHHKSDTRSSCGGRTEQIRGYAFAIRAHAVDHAAKVIRRRQLHLAHMLRQRPMRALRAHYNLPLEIW